MARDNIEPQLSPNVELHRCPTHHLNFLVKRLACGVCILELTSGLWDISQQATRNSYIKKYRYG